NRIGCYKDKASPRDLPLLHHSKSTTPESCVSRCKARKYKYAGLQAGAWCLCGNSYGRHGKARNADCNMRCSGNSRKTCGGPWRNDVLATGYSSRPKPSASNNKNKNTEMTDGGDC
uniref:WSC domain-containing protein n=2 Tax=Macrostomum lignano TaxID=282301 RepID=A0A1I8G396_9PLAT